MSDSARPPDRKSESLRDWLIAQRSKAGLTQQDLATHAGVTQATISNIETGSSRNPHPRTWDAIVAAFKSLAPASAVTVPGDEKHDAQRNDLNEETLNAARKAASEEASIAGIGEFIDFEPHDEDDLPDEPGVYVFYDVTERPTYIGQSQNIRVRIRGKHDEKFWYRAPIVQTAAYIRIEEKEQRLRIEKLLITVLRSHALINKAHVQRGIDDGPSS